MHREIAITDCVFSRLHGALETKVQENGNISELFPMNN